MKLFNNFSEINKNTAKPQFVVTMFVPIWYLLSSFEKLLWHQV